MPASLKKSLVIAGLHAGMATAVQRFETWTGGWDLDAFGVENVLTTSCAEAIWQEARHFRVTLSLESKFQDICDASGCPPPGRGKPKTAKANLKGKPSGRVDLVLWHANDTPRAVIELKRVASTSGLLDDAGRLIDFIQALGRLEGGSVRYGLLGTIVRAPDTGDALIASARAAKRLQALEALANRRGVTFVPHGPQQVKRTYEGKAAFTYVFEFKPKTSRA